MGRPYGVRIGKDDCMSRTAANSRRQVTWVLRKAEYLAIHLATREARALLGQP